MAGLGCGKCGSSIDSSSRFCPSCGNATSGYGANLIGLEPLDASGSSSSGDASSKRTAKNGETRSWLALALAAVVLLGGLILLDRGSSSDDDTAAEESSEADSADDDNNSAERSTTTTIQRGTTTTAVRSITTDLASPAAADSEPREPSFTDGAEPWGSDVDLALGVDATLYLAGITGTVWSVDLSSGVWDEPIELNTSLSSSRYIDVRPTAILFSRDGPGLLGLPNGGLVQAYRFDRPDEPLVDIAAGDWQLPSDRDDEIVVARFNDGPGLIFSYVGLDLDGNEQWVRRPPVSAFATGAVGGAVLLQWLGQTVLFEEGDATVIADGPPLGFDGEALVWGDCKLDLTCTARAGTVDDPNLLAFPSADITQMSGFGGPISPVEVDLDAGVLVLTTMVQSGNSRPEPSIEVHRESGLENSRGVSALDFGEDSVRLLPGGAWLAITAGSRVELWNWATDETRTINAPMMVAGVDFSEG